MRGKLLRTGVTEVKEGDFGEWRPELLSYASYIVE